MHYFILQQDERTKTSLLLQEPRHDGSRDHYMMYVREEQKAEYIDFIEHPRRLVSNRMKQLLELYDADLRWTSVVLTAKEAKRQELYWLFEPPELEVLSERTERDRLGTVKRVVLDGNKLKHERLFCAGDRCIVHLDVAESLLRRAYTGLRLTPVEVDDRFQE
ncbi:hypothetical protein [Paenibacillus lentus]|uniref:Uncharacterized protein n=1 Tax=Paenibacillus lentus TaxID=1338368 RepID=A0A3Q8S4S1_9BACL|nr:hypothetical protein [Paenibacillus lentus]AZK46682.1 hypothetical protein EIM92_11375 [Paenibacillus lentus]